MSKRIVAPIAALVTFLVFALALAVSAAEGGQ